MNFKMNKEIIFILLAMNLVILIGIVAAQEVSYCCEKTKTGVWCQDESKDKCDANYRMTPSSCETTSFCKLGYCYDSQEGLCAENTPQKTCEESGGVWNDGAQGVPPQCELGCCVLGNQASFVSLVRCKKLSASLGLTTDFRTDVNSEISCIALAQAQDEGACVFESDFQRTCKFTTRQECTEKNATFYKDFLCSAEDLGTICGPTEKTTCVKGKDEVYFVDSCGNPANIYDASRISDKSYWKKVVKKEESCGFNSNNANSAGCGNCDYLGGTMCKQYDRNKDSTRPRYGESICRDLSCKDTYNGNDYRHGESWCVYDGETGGGKDSVGSRQWRHICISGEEVLEPCADFRNYICIEDSIETAQGKFSQAGCRVNRWQYCIAQDNKDDCENTDQRDCVWKEGIRLGNSSSGTCFPDFTPGFKFWEQESASICGQASKQCVATFEKKIGSSNKCVDNCECLEQSWIDESNLACNLIGDCGSKKNYLGVLTTGGFETSVKKGK